MKSDSRITKWGNSLAIRIPLAIARQAQLNEGDSVNLTLNREGAIVLRPARRKYRLTDLVAQITPQNRHRETDWGQVQGKESW